MNRYAVAIVGCTFVAAAAYGAEGDQPFALLLEAKKVHEECLRLEAGDKRKYYWKADGAVDFNIHYHEGPEVFYPVKRDGMRGDGGTFVAKISQNYCWMWTAREKAVSLEGRIESK